MKIKAFARGYKRPSLAFSEHLTACPFRLVMKCLGIKTYRNESNRQLSQESCTQLNSIN